MLAAVLGASLVARDRSLARALDEVPTAQRSVRAAWFGVPGPGAVGWPELDRQARDALAPFGDPTALVLYRQSTVANRFVGIAGAEDVGRWVRLRSGRLPRPCRPSRCEVLRIGGEGALPGRAGAAARRRRHRAGAGRRPLRRLGGAGPEQARRS